MVKNVKVRLSTADRDALYEARINPIATFPRQGFVIYGQRTLQLKQSNLRSVNVRRMILEVKRVVIAIASRIVFEQNTPEKRKEFVDSVNAYLSLVKSQQGVEFFKVVMDDSNNTEEDKLLHKVNGRVIVKPVLAIENIAIDFIITNSGVQFTS
jgi:phage tail sheath protein FI